MPAYTLNPFADHRWRDLLLRHPSASIFHTTDWLTALERTYGYKPLVLTTCPPGTQLTNGAALCLVKSFLTGSRLVSLPFSDHCEPLAGSPDELDQLLTSIADFAAAAGCRYAQLRPLRGSPGLATGFAASERFIMHELPLARKPGEVFSRFSKDSIQRKIRRAERESVDYREGRSPELISDFYHLQLLTRRRHGLPPQPLRWFQEMIRSLGDSVMIRVALKDHEAIAAIVTLRFKGTMVYKYGCSDARYHSLGGLQMLLWRAIEEAIGDGLSTFDFGRSDVDNEGLAIFKDRWGATRFSLAYWTNPPRPVSSQKIWERPAVRRALSLTPDRLLAFSGRFLYKHVG